MSRPCHCTPTPPAAPYRAGTDCRLCWAWHFRPDVRAAWGGNPADCPPEPAAPPSPPAAPPVPTSTQPAPAAAAACPHRGAPTGRVVACRTCQNAGSPLQLPVLACAKHGQCVTGDRAPAADDVAACRWCADNPARRPHAPPPPPPAASVARPGDPAVGVVIGYSRWPALAALQLDTIRRTCGPVPVLVSADPDPHRPPAELAALAAVCARYGAELAVNPERIGHTGGDLAAFWRGVVWGFGHGLRVVAKLSQRFVVTRPRWLHDGAADLVAADLPAAARFAVQTPAEWGDMLRTEAMLLDVPAWNRPDVLARLAPRKRYDDKPGGYHAEHQINDLIREQLGGAYWPWELVSADRYARTPGVLWRMANGREEYDALAAAAGLTLPADFKTGGWEQEHQRGEYDFG